MPFFSFSVFLSFFPFFFFVFKLLKEVWTKLKFLQNLPTLKCGIQYVEVQGTNNMNITHNTPVIFWNVLYFTVTNFVFQECKFLSCNMKAWRWYFLENVPCTWFSRQLVLSCLDLASICIVVRLFKFSFQILKYTWFVVLYASSGWY